MFPVCGINCAFAANLFFFSSSSNRLIIPMQRADWFLLMLSVMDIISTPEPSSMSPL